MIVDSEWITDIDREIIDISGYGARRGFGKHPSLVVVDAQKKFVGLDKPILESMKQFPLGIGEGAVRAIEKISELLSIARRSKIPVFYITATTHADEMPYSSFSRKIDKYKKKMTISEEQNEIADAIKPQEGDTVIRKIYPSGFFGTPLMSFLNTLNRDTLIVTGFVTSGCVRAFVVDAASYNFNVGVVYECVADRFEFAHKLSLFDMDLKYADVINFNEAKEYLSGNR
jgi:nicotinamidase-related amidase